MKTFKTYISILCYAFTLQVLIYALLAKLELFPPMSVDAVFVHFLITLFGTVLIAITDRLPIGNELIASFIRIADIIIAVFGIGFAFGLIPVEWTYIVTIIGMILVIYVGVSAVVMIRDQADASAINKQLSRRLQQSKDAGGDSNE